MSLLEHLRSSSRVQVSDRQQSDGATAAPGQPAFQPDRPAIPNPPPPEVVRPRVFQRNEALLELKARVHEELIHELDPEQLLGDVSFTSPARRAVEQAAEERIAVV